MGSQAKAQRSIVSVNLEMNNRGIVPKQDIQYSHFLFTHYTLPASDHLFLYLSWLFDARRLLMFGGQLVRLALGTWAKFPRALVRFVTSKMLPEQWALDHAEAKYKINTQRLRDLEVRELRGLMRWNVNSQVPTIFFAKKARIFQLYDSSIRRSVKICPSSITQLIPCAFARYFTPARPPAEGESRLG